MLPAHKSLVLALIFCAFALPCAAQEKPWERSGNAGQSRSELPPEARIDINHAPLDQLVKLPGLTQVWAARIVRFRPYHSKVDLLERGVLPSAVYDRIKEAIVAHRDNSGAPGKEQKKKPTPKPYAPPAQPRYSW
ncbi:MAG: helix-hairpin-helix domain-containing protein [Terracidiphilus sp.]|nr:helix-hairpin-helix domain-containing protein [Terracidiphilus sp.]